jgi:hypothetical protein
VVYPLELQFYGDKAGRVNDPFGHSRGLAQRAEEISPEDGEANGQLLRRLKPAIVGSGAG